MNRAVVRRLSAAGLLAGVVVLATVSGMSTAAPVQWTVASGGNDHWYEFIYSPTGFTWEQASAAAGASSHLGMPGYLATVTSQPENNFLYAMAKYPAGATGTIFDPANPNVSLGDIDISGRDASTWLGGTDAATEGTWRWVNGPETGQVFWIGDGTTGSAPAGKFALWDNTAGGNPSNNEPNATIATEDFLQLRYTGGRWNDSGSGAMLTLPGFIPPANVNRIRAPAAYIVEYSPATPALTYTVTNLNDSGLGSLRDAVTQANQAPGLNTINFQAGLTGTIFLTSGQLPINDAVTIVGPGPGVLTVDGSGSSRVFSIFENVTDVCATPGVDFPVSISGLTVTNGLRNVAGSSGGGIYSEKTLTLTNVVVSNSHSFAGGGLSYNTAYPAQSLTIANSQFLNNVARPLSTTTAGSDGGALRVAERCATITSPSTIAISNSVISGNQTQPGATFLNSAGGGIHISQAADITITDTRIVGNAVVNQNPAVPGANNRGGGLSVDDGKTLRIERSEISGNFANRGGGLRMLSDLPARQAAGQELVATIVNSTISGNSAATPASGGGGMVVYGNVAVTIDNSTVYNNSSTSNAAGAIMVDAGVTNPASAANTLPPTVTLQSSIVAGSLNGAPDIGVNDETVVPAFTVNANQSLVGTFEPIVSVVGAGNLLGVNPLLGPLAFNGGTSRTHAVLSGSPALNSGSNPLALTTDQRGAGFPRVSGASTDMGSFESSGAVAPPATFVVTNLNDSGAGSLRDAINLANNALGPNTVTFTPGLSGTILLTSTNGSLRITDEITIVGPGAGVLTIDGNATNRIFSIFGPDPACPSIDGPDFLVTMSGLRLTNGRRTQSNSGGAISSAHSLALDSMTIDHNTSGNGGGITVLSQYPGMSVTISNTKLQNNTVQPLAGPTSVAGGALAFIERCTGIRTTPFAVSISNSEFSGNVGQPVTLGGFGGAIYSSTNADIAITDTRIVDNHVNAPNPPIAGQNYQGGGFYGTARSLTILRSEISGNSVFDTTGSDQTRSGGLHLFNSAPDLQAPDSGMVVKLINSTVSGNQVSATGGAMIAFGNVDLELDNTTVSDNVAAPTRTGGIILSTGATNPVSASNATAPTLRLVSSIVANSVGDAGDISSNVATIPLATIDATNSLIEKVCPSPNCEIVGTGNLIGTDPQLGPLAFNGGTTRTHAPQGGSPVINAGSNPLALTTDQRGGAFARVVGAAADMGSFETGGVLIPAPVIVNVKSRKVHGAAGTFDIALSAVSTNPTTEPRFGPAQTLVFTFDKPVTAGTATVTEGTATAAAATFSGNEMIVPLTGVANPQYVTVAVSNVASADGGVGGGASIRVGFLAGDVNQNRAVTLSDLGQVNAQVAQAVTAANYLKDVNASGTLSLADKGLTNGQLTKVLPAP